MGFCWDRLVGPVWVGVVNVTPDSFSDGGRYVEAGAALGRVRELVKAGAGVVELGAEASSFFRPGIEAVSGEEQWGRLGGILSSEFRVQSSELGEGVVLAVDTRLAFVARKALGAGVAVVNDISAGEFDGRMLETVGELGGGMVLMHCGGSFPQTPGADDADIVETVREYLAGRVAAAERAGILRERIAVDPGVGFGKTMGDNWRLAMGAGELRELGVEVMLGVSRKRFLGTAVPGEVAGEFAGELERVRKVVAAGGVTVEHERDEATAAVTMMAWRRGVRVHRVHNVGLCAAAVSA